MSGRNTCFFSSRKKPLGFISWEVFEKVLGFDFRTSPVESETGERVMGVKYMKI